MDPIRLLEEYRERVYSVVTASGAETHSSAHGSDRWRQVKRHHGAERPLEEQIGISKNAKKTLRLRGSRQMA